MKFTLLFIVAVVIVGAWWLWSQSLQIDESWLKKQKEIAMSSPQIPGGKIQLSNEEWKKRLTPQQYYVLREKGTEKAYSGKYDKFKEKGIYVCAACALPLFSSKAKFDSGTGWPSFWEPIKPENVHYEEDRTLFTLRIEVQCARCSSHIGHVFDDGPAPTGKRYCMNSIALNFIPEAEVEKESADN